MNNILRKQTPLPEIAKNNIPKEIHKYLNIKYEYNFTFSNNVYSCYIKEKGLYLKVGKDLNSEMLNTVYFNQKGLAGEVLEYVSNQSYEYLLTRCISGENGTNKKYLDNPKKLAEYYGRYLREVHSIKYDNSQNTFKIEDLITQARENVGNREFNIQSFFENNGFTPQKGLLILEDLKSCYVEDVYLHGSYRLENIIMQDFNLKGIVGLDSCGIGDRHYDICYGINSLRKHLNTKEYGDVFLESYGYDEIDRDRLIFCKILIILN